MAINPEEEVVYSDVNVELGRTSSYELVYNEDAIKTSILSIIRTRRGSRPFRRNFGSGILDMLFDPIDNVTAMRIRTYLQEDIGANEPRLVLSLIEVLPDYDNQTYFVNIEGSIPRLENRKFDFTFNLKRTTR